MNDLLAVGIGHSFENLFGKAHRRFERHPAAEPVGEGPFAERQDEHKMLVDEVRVFQWQDVRMVELRRQPDFIFEVSQDVVVQESLIWDFQSDANALDVVHRLIDACEPA